MSAKLFSLSSWITCQRTSFRSVWHAIEATHTIEDSLAGTNTWRWLRAVDLRESLRDIEACLHSVSGKLYHMGFRGRVARTNLADANEAHDWRIFADFAQVLIGIARPLYARDQSASTWRKAFTHWIPRPSICACHCSVGQIPEAQSRRQDAHAAGPARQYPHVYPHYRRQSARRPTSSTRFCRRLARSM